MPGQRVSLSVQCAPDRDKSLIDASLCSNPHVQLADQVVDRSDPHLSLTLETLQPLPAASQLAGVHIDACQSSPRCPEAGSSVNSC